MRATALNATTPHPDTLQLGNHVIGYHLLRSRRRSIGFLINHDGLRVTAPYWVSLADIKAAIISKQTWILTKLKEQQSRPPPQVEEPVIWTTGATLPFLGQTVTLHIRYGEPSYFDEELNVITINLPSDASPAQCKKHLVLWLAQQARHQFSERLPYFAKQLGVHYHSFSLSNATTRWGSCNSLGKIKLNWRLIHFSPHLIDYVIAHELAHRIEMNHSPRFWAIVEKVFPTYLAAREELKQLGLTLLPL